MEQRDWMELALEGDRTARAQLFEQNIESIYYLCWKLTGSAAQAGELTRRTFARAFSNLSELRPDAGFDRWVTAIAVNLCRQTMRKTQSWLFTTSEKEMAQLRNIYVADEACLPPGCPENPELRSLALRTIGQLPPEQRVCMVLRYVALLKPHQIARTMEVDEITVLGRLNSGRRALMNALPSDTPQALVTALFAQEAAALPVPELLRGSCMQTVLNAQNEPTKVEPLQADEETEEITEKQGFLGNMTKKQKYLFFGGIGVAAFLVFLLLILAFKGCSKTPEPEPKPLEPTPVEEIDEDLESAALLEEYGVEMLLTCTRRDAENLIEAWQPTLADYIIGGTTDDINLEIESSNDQVTRVALSLENTDLDITRLRDLDLGSEPELSAAASAISSKYDLKCYQNKPLFDPEDRADSSIAAYSENYRYELLDENEDGRAEALSITRTGAGFDPQKGIFHPYGDTLTDLLGLNKSQAQELLGEGNYPDNGNIDRFTMHQDGASVDDSKVSMDAIFQARTDMDAARQTLSAITLHVDGCFAELLPELKLPDSALTLDQMSRKLQALSGHLGLLEGDVFDSLTLKNGQSTLVYYDGVTRYLFIADSTNAKISQVELLDLADCKLFNASKCAFSTEGFDLEKLLGMDSYEAYAHYGIRHYATADLSSTVLGLWEADGAIRTIYNAGDPRPLWGIALGDSRETIEEMIEQANGYCSQDEEDSARYVLSGDRELAVTYSNDKAAILQLEDHSYQDNYTAPSPLRKRPEELFSAFLETIPNAKTTWFGDLTHDGEGDLLVCSPSGSGCLLQLYVIKDNEVNLTPIYTQSISVSDATNVYVIDHDSGKCLFLYTLSESLVGRECRWKLLSINASGSEVVLGQNDASVNMMDMMLGDQEGYDNAKQQADGYLDEGRFLCGTQSGAAEFADYKASLE